MTSPENNIKMSVKDGILTIQVKVGMDEVMPRLSKGGNTMLVATSSGFIPIPDTNMKLNLNITMPR